MPWVAYVRQVVATGGGGGGGGAPSNIAGSPSGAASFTATFDIDPTGFVAGWGYAVQYGTTLGGPYPYRQVLADATSGQAKQIVVPNLAASQTWYAVVVAYSASPNYTPSLPSGETVYTT